jgi:WD40 repeat protein
MPVDVAHSGSKRGRLRRLTPPLLAMLGIALNVIGAFWVSWTLLGPSWIRTVALSPDGSVLVALATDGFWTWDLTTQRPLRRKMSIPVAEHRIDDASLQSLDSSTLVFVRKERGPSALPPEVIYWDLGADTRLRSIALPYAPYYYALAPEADLAVIAPRVKQTLDELSLGKEWPILDLQTGRQIGAIPIGVDRGDGVGCTITLSRDGRRLAANILRKGSGWGMEVWDVPTRQRIFEADQFSVRSLSADGATLAIWSAYTYKHQFWRLDGPELLWESDAPMGYVHCIPGGQTILADSHSLGVWSIDEQRCITELVKRSEFDATALAISANGARIAAVRNKSILLWDTNTLQRATVR